MLIRQTITEPPEQYFVAAVTLVPALRIRIRMFLDLLDPDPDPLVKSTDPYPDPSTIKRK
jgi:hypothetical protein